MSFVAISLCIQRILTFIFIFIVKLCLLDITTHCLTHFFLYIYIYSHTRLTHTITKCTTNQTTLTGTQVEVQLQYKVNHICLYLLKHSFYSRFASFSSVYILYFLSFQRQTYHIASFSSVFFLHFVYYIHNDFQFRPPT